MIEFILHLWLVIASDKTYFKRVYLFFFIYYTNLFIGSFYIIWFLFGTS